MRVLFGFHPPQIFKCLKDTHPFRIGDITFDGRLLTVFLEDCPSHEQKPTMIDIIDMILIWVVWKCWVNLPNETTIFQNGIMISKTIGYNGVQNIFRQTHIVLSLWKILKNAYFIGKINPTFSDKPICNKKHIWHIFWWHLPSIYPSHVSIYTYIYIHQHHGSYGYDGKNHGFL